MSLSSVSSVSLGETMMALTLGAEIEKDTVQRGIAGAESNFAIGMARLGITSSWVSALGEASIGKYVRASVEDAGVNVSHVQMIPGKRTGLLVKQFSADSSLRVEYDRAHSAFSTITLGETDWAFMAKHDVLHSTGITAAVSEEGYHAAREAMREFSKRHHEHQDHLSHHDLHGHRKLIIFDLNIRNQLWQGKTTQHRLTDLATQSDLVLGSPDEFARIMGVDEGDIHNVSPEDAAKFARTSLPRKDIIIKLSEYGAWLVRAGGEEIYVGGFPVAKVVDPIGAGDAFAAGVAAAILYGKDPRDWLRYGNAMGAFAVSAVGDTGGLPSRSELEAFLERPSSNEALSQLLPVPTLKQRDITLERRDSNNPFPANQAPDATPKTWRQAGKDQRIER